MLSQLYTESRIRDLLIPAENWRPHPRRADRETWEALDPEISRNLVARGEAALGCEWPPLPATVFLQYARQGNRRNFERLSFARRSRLQDLVIAECVEARDRFLDAIVDGVWVLCEESYWGVPAHLHMQKAGPGLPDVVEPTVDLFVAETFSLLAWTYYLLGERFDSVSPLVRPRIALEIERRGLAPLEQREDFGWMGFKSSGRRVNNWNPWIVSNWLAALLLIETDPERRARCFHKALRALDNFIDPYPADGGCDEGPSYWGRAGASLFDCLELIGSATGGHIDVYADEKIRHIGCYIYRAQIAGDYFLNFADASAIVSHSPALIYRYGKKIDDPDMVAFGAWCATRSSGVPRDSIGRLLPALSIGDELRTTEARQPLPRDVWMDQIQVMAARDKEGSAEGLYVAAKGGTNNESHNHNDIGNFVVYAGGDPLVVDAGVETYTRQTFSARRYEIWTMRSSYHTLLPTIGGVEQAPGASFRATDVLYTADERTASLTLDIARAYPAEAGVEKWQRHIALHRSSHIEVVDEYALSREVPEIAMSLLTPSQVDLSEPGSVRLSRRAFAEGRASGAGLFTYPAEMQVSCEKIPIADERLGGVWGSELARVVLRAERPARQGSWSYRIS